MPIPTIPQKTILEFSCTPIIAYATTSFGQKWLVPQLEYDPLVGTTTVLYWVVIRKTRPDKSTEEEEQFDFYDLNCAIKEYNRHE